MDKLERAGPAYGIFRPLTAPPGSTRHKAEMGRGEDPPSPVSTLDDPRHLEGNPQPWLRYFFPQDFELREGEQGNPFYQYFDVGPADIKEDLAIPPPSWCPNAYFRLSFTQINVPEHQLIARKHPEVLVDPDAIDLTANNAHLLAEGNEAHLHTILAFCRSVTTFAARTWKDAFPLVDLLRGLLLYMLDHMEIGQKIAEAKCRREFASQLAAEAARQAAKYQQQLQEVAAAAEAEYDAKLAALTDKLRSEVGEDLQFQLRSEKEEKAALALKVSSLEAQVRKLGESSNEMQRQLEAAAKERDTERAANNRALGARDADVAAAEERVRVLEGALAKAQGAVLSALRAEGKAEVMDVALAALEATVPGCAAYVAELKVESDLQPGAYDPAQIYLPQPSASIAGSATAVAAGNSDTTSSANSSLSAAALAAMSSLPGFAPGFLQSPLGAPGTGSSMLPSSSSREGSGPAGGLSSRSSSPARGSRRPQSGDAAALSGSAGAAGSGGAAGGEGGAPAEDPLVFKYVNASPQQKFMVGRTLNQDQGVSWQLADTGTELNIQDVATHPGVHFFGGGSGRRGSYLALPLLGCNGEVLGMFCLDTVGPPSSSSRPGSSPPGANLLPISGGGFNSSAGAASGISAGDAAFARELAAIVQARIRKDQEALAARMAAVAAVEAAELLEASAEKVPALDPEPYADMPGGLTMFSGALGVLRKLSASDLDAFRNMTQPDDATLAVLRSVLGTVGEVGEADWAHLRLKVDKELIERLAGMNPQDAWAEWQQLCKSMQPITDLESSGAGGALSNSLATISEEGEDAAATAPGGRVNLALTRWMGAVRKISAALAYQKVLEQKLLRANAALMRTFQGDGSSSLNELRSYRVPPKLTYLVLQAVLSLCGHEGEEAHNWGRMRTLTNYKLIKRLTQLRPATTSKPVLSSVAKLMVNVDEAEVQKESVATLSLYRWLNSFIQLGHKA